MRPGHGIKPWNPELGQGDLNRVGEQYAEAMYKEFNGDPQLAAMAYNWGEGNVKAAIRRLGDPSKGEVGWNDFLQHARGTPSRANPEGRPIRPETVNYVLGIRGRNLQTPPNYSARADQAAQQEYGQQAATQPQNQLGARMPPQTAQAMIPDDYQGELERQVLAQPRPGAMEQQLARRMEGPPSTAVAQAQPTVPPQPTVPGQPRSTGQVGSLIAGNQPPPQTATPGTPPQPPSPGQIGSMIAGTPPGGSQANALGGLAAAINASVPPAPTQIATGPVQPGSGGVNVSGGSLGQRPAQAPSTDYGGAFGGMSGDAQATQRYPQSPTPPDIRPDTNVAGDPYLQQMMQPYNQARDRRLYASGLDPTTGQPRVATNAPGEFSNLIPQGNTRKSLPQMTADMLGRGSGKDVPEAPGLARSDPYQGTAGGAPEASDWADQERESQKYWNQQDANIAAEQARQRQERQKQLGFAASRIQQQSTYDPAAVYRVNRTYEQMNPFSIRFGMPEVGAAAPVRGGVATPYPTSALSPWRVPWQPGQKGPQQ